MDFGVLLAYDYDEKKTKVNHSRNLLKMKDINSEEVEIIELLRGSVGHKYEKNKAGKLRYKTLKDKVEFTIGKIRQMGKRKPSMIGLGPRDDHLCG